MVVKPTLLWMIPSSNRTFMELKLPVATRAARTLPSSNRTFMELKYQFGDRLVFERFVLIVPLWN